MGTLTTKGCLPPENEPTKRGCRVCNDAAGATTALAGTMSNRELFIPPASHRLYATIPGDRGG
ncbi:hypothetical protein WN55_07814 [Dufourea novaeangliae]|uniref:Uncharacterized protein n=1 Tax=Dufourea novaeangliae TaxID=178035 RepID=A0A154PSS1_DUFNO|nr:hypothetical protein WN55_07814 [Dufourea novaeangliae]